MPNLVAFETSVFAVVQGLELSFVGLWGVVSALGVFVPLFVLRFRLVLIFLFEPLVHDVRFGDLWFVVPWRGGIGSGAFGLLAGAGTIIGIVPCLLASVTLHTHLRLGHMLPSTALSAQI